MEAILKMIRKHPNVYADISYHAKPGLARKIYDIIAQIDILNTRLMFGTDDIMIMRDKNLGGLHKYFDHFTELNHTVLCDNERDFLKI